jgi:hypothetical protein
MAATVTVMAARAAKVVRAAKVAQAARQVRVPASTKATWRWFAILLLAPTT